MMNEAREYIDQTNALMVELQSVVDTYDYDGPQTLQAVLGVVINILFAKAPDAETGTDWLRRFNTTSSSVYKDIIGGMDRTKAH